MQALDNYLSSSAPGAALLLNGNWGAGKSYAWARYVRSSLSDLGLFEITVSAAGLCSREDLDRALFHASLEDLGSESLREAVGVISKAALRFVNIEPNDLKLKADINPNTTVIAIDDVERFAGDFEVLFGFALDLVDATFRCVLIADEARAVQKFSNYGIYKERLVGRTVVVNPKVGEFVTNVINEIPLPEVQRILSDNAQGFVDLLEQKKVTNLRTVRTIISEMVMILRELPLEQVLSLEKLFNSVCFWILATAANANSLPLVCKAFGISGLSTIIHLRSIRKTDESDDLDELISLLERTGFLEESHNFGASTELSRLASGEEVDYLELARQLDIIPRPTTGGQSQTNIY